MKKLAVALMMLALASVASAQTKPQNPREGEFTASPDHAQIDRYVLGFFRPGAAEPVQTQDIGKPTPDAQNVCTFTFNSQPLGFGLDYVARVKAYAAGAESPWSEISNPFDRIPGPPSRITIK